MLPARSVPATTSQLVVRMIRLPVTLLGGSAAGTGWLGMAKMFGLRCLDDRCLNFIFARKFPGNVKRDS